MNDVLIEERLKRTVREALLVFILSQDLLYDLNVSIINAVIK